MARTPPLDPLCPSIQAALDLLGKPWTGLVLAVLQNGALRFSELSTQMAPIGDKILSARLKELEAKGLVTREVDAGPPVRVGYRLTAKGLGFRKVVEAIDAWGRQFPSEAEELLRSPTLGARARRAEPAPKRAATRR